MERIKSVYKNNKDFNSKQNFQDYFKEYYEKLANMNRKIQPLKTRKELELEKAKNAKQDIVSKYDNIMYASFMNSRCSRFSGNSNMTRLQRQANFYDEKVAYIDKRIDNADFVYFERTIE